MNLNPSCSVQRIGRGRKKIQKYCRLVIHNFGNSEIEIPLTDRTEKAIAVSGNVQEKEDHGNFYLKLDGYASVVYLLKN